MPKSAWHQLAIVDMSIPFLAASFVLDTSLIISLSESDIQYAFLPIPVDFS